jgi:hypothetical protein
MRMACKIGAGGSGVAAVLNWSRLFIRFQSLVGLSMYTYAQAPARKKIERCQEPFDWRVARI